MVSVDRLSRSFIVLPLTSFVAREALRGMQSYQLSYWDQIWAVARLNQIPVIPSPEQPTPLSD